MKTKLNYVITLLLISVLFGVTSCNSEDYPDVNNNDDSLGEIKSFIVRPGFNMALIEGIIVDPNISEAIIYWNDQSESISAPINNNNISVQIENLQENKLYTFQIKSLDAHGNNSNFVSAGTTVYGPNYVRELKNRNISTSKLNGTNLNLSFSSADLTSGILGTELFYINSEDIEKEILIDPNNNDLYISDFKSGSTLKHRSYFVYSPLSLDTLYTDYTTHKPFVLPVLGNASVPYLASETGGRWGTLAEPWITNEAAKNHDGFGGWDEKNDNIFNLESGWGSPYIVNGKIHQVINAEPANYRLTVEVLNTNHDTNVDGAYFVIAKGNTGLPDLEEIETSTEVIGYQKIELSGTYTVDFILDESTDISIGEVTTQNGNLYCNITSWSLSLAN
ncbi:DUF4998 domain-containing protein [Formosa haliotis]|uniref:DUF4998 domain-containing protein n=1 Tax=Formosa haliotis TaxID=1555194 RepID=UPI0008269A9E|nr:DUF4998 domain-containing protein [Formosa haliotis]